MSTPAETLSSSTKLEIAERAAWRQLLRTFNDELGVQEDAWAALDKEDAGEADVIYTAINLERLRPNAFHRGARPSITRLPADHYPALTVMADIVRPDAETALQDSRNVFRDALWIEVIVRSERYAFDDPDESMSAEALVDKRAKRSGEAAIQAIMRDRTLGRVVEPIESAPALTVNEPFELTAGEPDDSGKRIVFAAARVDFTLKVYSALPNVVEPVPDLLLAGIGS